MVDEDRSVCEVSDSAAFARSNRRIERDPPVRLQRDTYLAVPPSWGRLRLTR
jgi:hypothetical protein